jgi:hypothetical protein
MKQLARVILFVLIGLGLFASGRLVWREITLGQACPVVGSVPLCYVALIGYVLITAGAVGSLRSDLRWPGWAFYPGVAIAGGLALVGSSLEVIIGNVCPRAGSVPMCFISLLLSAAIAGLYRFQR